MEFCHSYLFVTFVVMTVDQIVGLHACTIFAANNKPPVQCTIDFEDKFFVYCVFMLFIVKQFVTL